MYLLQDQAVSLTGGRDWREFVEEGYGTRQQTSEVSLVDEVAQVWVPIHAAKNEHVTELPATILVLIMPHLNIRVTLTRVRCHEC